MQYGAILDIGKFTDPYGIDITPDNHAVPDTGMASQFDITQNCTLPDYKGSLTDDRFLAQIFKTHLVILSAQGRRQFNRIGFYY